MAQMEPHVARAVLHWYEQHGKVPTTTAAARKLLEAWLSSKGYERDRYGNYLKPVAANGDRLRWHFKDQVLRHEKKRHDRTDWIGLESRSIIETAQNVLENSARAAGREDILGRVQKVKGVRKEASSKRASAAEAKRAMFDGPGFYVVNQTTHGMGRMNADHERPFSTYAEAEDFARRKLAELAGMGFHYLMPVMVIEADSRQVAELPIAALTGGARRHVWWIDGKFKGSAVDPRQGKFPGFASGRTGSEDVHPGALLPLNVGERSRFEAHGNAFIVGYHSRNTFWLATDPPGERRRWGTRVEIMEDIARVQKTGALPPASGPRW